MNRIPFIFNPSSGGGLSSRVKKTVMDNATELSIHASKNAEDYQELVKYFIKEEVPRLIISGGDGTINQALPHFLGKKTAMGVFPTGTMNVFARELGIHNMTNNQIMETMLEGQIAETDVFQVNETPFIQMAGIGYDAHLIEETCDEQKQKLGPLAYILSVAKVFGNKPPKIKVTTAEGYKVEGVCALLGNGSLYGGQFPIFNKANQADGLIDALIFKSSGYQAMLDLALKLTTENELHHIRENVFYLQTTSLTITSETELPLQLDGEYHGRNKKFTVKKYEHPLRIVKPNAK